MPATGQTAPPSLFWLSLDAQLPAFQAALPGSRGEVYLRQRGIPLALAQQLGVGYAAPGTWPHAARDWRGGRVVFPHMTPDGSLKVFQSCGSAILEEGLSDTTSPMR